MHVITEIDSKSGAMVHAQPQLVREHLLLCASRQFLEGDVQHWWHPPSGHGVRSRMAMDAVYERLVRRDHGLIQLLDPPSTSRH